MTTARRFSAFRRVWFTIAVAHLPFAASQFADFSGAFGDTFSGPCDPPEGGCNVHTFLASAESWGGYAHDDATASLYPLTLTHGGNVTFQARAVSGANSLRFVFEYNPYPNAMPSLTTATVFVNSSAFELYSVSVSKMDAPSSSSILYLIDRDRSLEVKDVLYTPHGAPSPPFNQPHAPPLPPLPPPYPPSPPLTIGYENCPTSCGWYNYMFNSKYWCAFGFTMDSGINRGGSMVRTCDSPILYEYTLMAVNGNPVVTSWIGHPVSKEYVTTAFTLSYTAEDAATMPYERVTAFFEDMDESEHHATSFGFAIGENMTLGNLRVQTPVACSSYPFPDICQPPSLPPPSPPSPPSPPPPSLPSPQLPPPAPSPPPLTLTVDCDLSTDVQAMYGTFCKEGQFTMPGFGSFTVYTFQAVKDTRNGVAAEIYVDVPSQFHNSNNYLQRIMWGSNACSANCEAYTTLTEEAYPFRINTSHECFDSLDTFTLNMIKNATDDPDANLAYTGINQVMQLGGVHMPSELLNMEHTCITVELLILDGQNASSLQVNDIYYQHNHIDQESFLEHQSPSPPRSPPAKAEGLQDPHLRLAHGGATDFRGKNDTLYNFISAPGFAMNVRIHLSDFWLHKRALLVHGSFMTQAHFNVRGVLNMTFDAARMNSLNYAWDMLTGTCGTNRFAVGPHGVYNCSAGAVLVQAEYSSVEVRAEGWEVRVTSQPVYDWITGPHHRLDIRAAAKTPRRGGGGGATTRGLCDAHGVLGQSFTQTRREGARDDYPAAGEFTTRAMGEGAIDGTAEDYEVLAPYEWRFRFSAFEKAKCESASLSQTGSTLAHASVDAEDV